MCSKRIISSLKTCRSWTHAWGFINSQIKTISISPYLWRCQNHFTSISQIRAASVTHSPGLAWFGFGWTGLVNSPLFAHCLCQCTSDDIFPEQPAGSTQPSCLCKQGQNQISWELARGRSSSVELPRSPWDDVFTPTKCGISFQA